MLAEFFFFFFNPVPHAAIHFSILKKSGEQHTKWDFSTKKNFFFLDAAGIVNEYKKLRAAGKSRKSFYV